MTLKDFYDNFNKIYGESEEKEYIFKIANGIILLGEPTAEVERSIIGIGINPDTLIGIRLCDENKFYLRDTETEMMYECESAELYNYRENNMAKKIFQLLGRLIKSININGAKILFHKSCEDKDFSHYSAAVAMGFSHLFCKKLRPAELLPLILPNNISFSENAEELLSLSAIENKCILIENQLPVYLPLSMEKYKIIITVTKEKAFKYPDFKKILKDLKELKSGSEFSMFSHITDGEIELYRNHSEYPYAIFARDERERIVEATTWLAGGDIFRFGEILKKSAVEYLKIAGKSAGNVKTLYEISAGLSIGCGIYKNRGIYSIVDNSEVDKFVREVGEMYEKKAGTKPEFYICSSSESRGEEVSGQ